MGILEMDFERILGVAFFISSFHSIMLYGVMQFSLKLCTFEVQLMMKIAEYARAMMEGYVTTFFLLLSF